MKNVKLLFIMVLLTSCVLSGGDVQLGVPKKLPTQTVPLGPAVNPLTPNAFTFNTASDYTASDSSIVVDAGNNNLVKLLGLDQIDNLTSGASGDLGFEAGGLTGTEGVIFNAGNKITLDTTANNLSELDKFWTPQYSHLVAYWKMNGAPGSLLNGDTIEDEIGSVDGTVAGTGLSYVSGKMNQYISGYNSSGNDYITMGVTPTLANFAHMTVGVWVYPTNLSGTQTILGQEEGYKIELIDNGGTDVGSPVFYVGSGSGWDCSAKFNSPLIVNHWYYISGTYDGTNATIYVNGIQGDSCFKTGTTGTTTKRLLIGGWDASPTIPGAGEPFSGAIDEVQIWDKALTIDEVQTITFKQLRKHSGNYYSRIMAGSKVITDWTNFGVKTTYPLRPLSTSADPAAYASQTTDFSTNLIALWHLDESSYNGTGGEVIDSSGHNINGYKSSYGGAITNTKGLFGKAATGNGVDYLVIPNDSRLDGVSKLSISAWFYRGDNMALSPEKGGAIYGKRNGYGVEHAYTAFIEDGNSSATDGKLCIDIDTADDRFCSNVTIPYFEWVHMTVTYDGTDSDPNNRVKLYLNGVLDKTAYETSTSIPNYASDLLIGALNNNYFKWIGKIDEFGIWNRTFTPAQVAELYRRGANNTTYQIRTCTNADCSDRTNNSGWIGPDGTQTSFFSEETNTSLTTTPYFDFSINASLASWLATENKKYFQYRAVLESSSTTYLPEVTEVAVGPTHYSSSKPYVTSKPVSAISFATLTSFTQTLGAGVCASGGGVTYQLAAGVSGWKFWNGTTWATATSESDSNTANVVNTNIAAFATLYGSTTANSDLNLKTILNSDGVTPCEVDTVTVTGLKH